MNNNGSPAENATAFAAELGWLAEALDVGLLADPERAALTAAVVGLRARLAEVGPVPTSDFGVARRWAETMPPAIEATARQPGRVCPVCLGLTVDRAGRCAVCRPAPRAALIPRRMRAGRLRALADRAAWFRGA